MGLIRGICFGGILLFSTSLIAAPKLRLSQTAIGPVSVAMGATATLPAVETANAGDGSLNLRVASSAEWLVANLGQPRECSIFRSQCTPIELQVRAGSLARGTYTGIVTVTDPNAIDAPQTVTVTVNVGGGVPERLDFVLPNNGASATQPFFTGSPLTVTTATAAGGNWLAASLEGSGSFRFSYPYRVTAQHLPGMAEGAYAGTVTTTGSALASENRSVPVTLRITSQPIAQLGAERLEFRTAQGSARQQQFAVLSNRGTGTLDISGVTATTTSGGNWLAAERVAGQTLVQVSANPAGLAPGTYAGTVAVATNSVQGTVNVPVQLTVGAAGPAVAFYQGVVNNATFEAGDAVAPGSIVAVFGEQFTTGEPRSAAALPLTNDLGGTRVFVNDQPAPVYYVSYNQINFQIPYGTEPGDAVVRVEREGQRGNSVSVRVGPAAPRLLRLSFGNYAIAVNTDGTFPIPATPGIQSRPARPGDTLVFYALGLGQTEPNVTSGAAAPSSPLARVPGTFRITFGSAGPFGGGSAEAVPQFVGLTPNFVGLYQINVTIPPDAPRGLSVPVALEGDRGSSNRVNIAIE